jgi:hypothetical protein
MTPPSRPVPRAGTSVLDDAQHVVDTLVAHHLLSPDQAPAAVDALTASAPAATPARSRAAEVAGYAGGALVVSAAGLFLTTSWSSLDQAGRVGVLAAAALVLAVAGAALAGRLWRALRQDADSPRRRLVSTLWVGAAWCAGSAAYVAADEPFDIGSSAPSWLVGGAVALVASAAGYALVPSLLGQVAVWGALWWMVHGGAELLHIEYGNVYGTGLVVLGVAWALLGVRRVLRERDTAVALGAVMALFGAQTPLLQGTAALAYVLTGALAAACFAAYLRLHGWPLLAGGVAATTFVVPEVVRDATDDALPVTGVLLLAGLTLLAACALGLRLRAEPVGRHR